jgi:hypothetical protein
MELLNIDKLNNVFLNHKWGKISENVENYEIHWQYTNPNNITFDLHISNISRKICKFTTIETSRYDIQYVEPFTEQRNKGKLLFKLDNMLTEYENKVYNYKVMELSTYFLSIVYNFTPCPCCMDHNRQL